MTASIDNPAEAAAEQLETKDPLQKEMQRNPVFILGSPRSGTTILADALRKAGYFGYGEGHLLNMLLPVTRVIERHLKNHVAPDKGQLLFNLKQDELFQEIFFSFKRIQSQLNPKEPWLDKTPDADMIRAVPILSRLWPTAVFVFAKRRGIETIISRTKKFPETNFEQHCINWAEAMRAWREVRGSGIQGIEVDQYDTAHHPAETAARLGVFLSLNESSTHSLLDEILNSRPQRTDDHSTSRVVSLQTSGWSPQQMEVFRTRCWAEMKAYGYTLDESYRKSEGMEQTSGDATITSSD